MTTIQLQNSNLNAGLSNKEKVLQGSISSHDTLHASMSSKGDLQASITATETLYASVTSQNTLKATIVKDRVLTATVSKPNTIGITDVVLETKTVTPTKEVQDVTPSSGKFLGKVTVTAIPDDYIITADANTIAEHILENDIAYVDGKRIIGKMPNNGDIHMTIDGLTSTSVDIPLGYTPGGTVSLTSDIDDALADIAGEENDGIQPKINMIAGEVDTQAVLIEQIKSALNGKTGGNSNPAKEEQEKTVDITENGTTEVLPDEGKTLSKVTVNINVESGGAVGDPDLPAGYRRASYIRFNNAQIVDSGIVCNQNTKIHVLFTRESSGSVYLYGVSSSGNTASVTAYLSTNGSWRFGNKYTPRPISTDDEIIHNAIVTKTGVKHETGTASLSGVTDFETVGTLLIGACRDSDGTLPSESNVKYTGVILLFEMWEGDAQVLKLIPVVSAEGQYRFFDMVSQTFFDSITSTPLDGGNL